MHPIEFQMPDNGIGILTINRSLECIRKFCVSQEATGYRECSKVTTLKIMPSLLRG